MTIAEAERFYEKDTKDYEIEKNKDFLTWLKTSIKNGYHCFMKTEELQELIDSVVNWYEIKYPERELEYFEGTRHLGFQGIRRISDVMDIRQLLFRLPHNQLCLIECGYRAKGWGQYPIYENGKEIDLKVQIFMKINKKNKEECNPWYGGTTYFLLQADYMTGEVLNYYELEDYIDNEENISLDELLSVFNEKYSNELDFTELTESVYDHNCDMELRDRILQLVALKLLYSRNTIPERGYERAKRFINEFNKKLGLALSTEQIDEIIHRDYTNGERWEHVLKTYVDEEGEEHSYWTVENVAKKEQSIEESKGLKRLAKIMLNKNRK